MVPEHGGSTVQVQVNHERERLVVEQALLAYREVQAAGVAAFEDATLETGRRQMRLVLEPALGSQAGAQKTSCHYRPVNAGVD